MEHVGRHTIVCELASSPVLSTFEATDDEGRAVRLRVVDAGLELDEAALDRFDDELARVAELRHPGIDRPLAWSTEGAVHVSTPLARGASLRAICDAIEAGRVAVEVAAGVGADLAEALHAAHSAGLVHAGLSLESILVGVDGRARVTDLGLMRWLNDRSATHAEVMRGSIESLAPEQLSAPDTVGPHTDVFGLGLALYRAMTGKPAFEAPSPLGVSIRLSMGKPTPIEAHGVEIAEELRALVMKMLSASPAARPPMELVMRELSKSCGPSWRDSARTLAASVSRPEAEPEREAPAPREHATREATPIEAATRQAESREPAPRAEPAREPVAIASPLDDLGAADDLEDAARWERRPSSEHDLVTEPELALPEARVLDEHPTIFELHAPAPREGEAELDELDAIPAHGGDTSVLPSAEEPPQDVPKTVILRAPSHRDPAPAPSIPAVHDAFAPKPRSPEGEPTAPPGTVAGAPSWAVWAAIALGAFALLVGTATLVILVAGA